MGKYTSDEIKEMLKDIMFGEKSKNLSDKEKENLHRKFELLTRPKNLERLVEMCNLLESSNEEDECS